MAKKIRQSELRPKFKSLPPELTGIEDDKPVQPRAPVPVTAWVDVVAGTVPIDAVAVEWNKKAVRIEWTNADGSSTTVWVYLGAISRR